MTDNKLRILDEDRELAEARMAELERLADTAGAVIVGRFTQRKEKPDAALFLGKG